VREVPKHQLLQHVGRLQPHRARVAACCMVFSIVMSNEHKSGDVQNGADANKVGTLALCCMLVAAISASSCCRTSAWISSTSVTNVSVPKLARTCAR
jgi:hypothetical protein